MLFLTGGVLSYSPADSILDEINGLLTITPKDPELYFQRGYYYYQREDFERASADFITCVRLDPRDLVYRFYKAKTDFKSGKMRTAIDGFKTVIEMNPKYAEAFFFLGILYHQVNEKVNALQAFDKAIDLNWNVAKYWAARARFKKENGEINEAVSDYQKAIMIEPDLAVAHYELAWINFEKHNIDSALEHAEKLVILEHNPLFYHTLACIYSEKNLRKAIENEMRALSLEPSREYEKSLAGFRQGRSYSLQMEETRKIRDEIMRKNEMEKRQRENIWNQIIEKNKMLR